MEKRSGLVGVLIQCRFLLVSYWAKKKKHHATGILLLQKKKIILVCCTPPGICLISRSHHERLLHTEGADFSARWRLLESETLSGLNALVSVEKMLDKYTHCVLLEWHLSDWKILRPDLNFCVRCVPRFIVLTWAQALPENCTKHQPPLSLFTSLHTPCDLKFISGYSFARVLFIRLSFSLYCCVLALSKLEVADICMTVCMLDGNQKPFSAPPPPNHHQSQSALWGTHLFLHR